MQIQEYDIQLIYKKGSEMYLADALSRAFPPEHSEKQFERDINSECFIHLMSSESYVTDRKIAAIRSEILRDESIRQLCSQIQQGWPEHRSLVPPATRAYFPYRHDLTTQDGLIQNAHFFNPSEVTSRHPPEIASIPPRHYKNKKNSS